jgi:hypothetical protein
MKKLLAIIALGLLLSGNSNAGSLYGTGKIEIEKYIYDYIYKYLGENTVRNKNAGASQRGTPGALAVSLTGKDTGASYCPMGRSCVSADIIQVKRGCERNAKKNKRPSMCKVMFYNRTLKWGGIKNKLSQNDDVETELAAVGITVRGSTSSNRKKKIKYIDKKNIEKKKNSLDIVSNLKKLNELYKSGILTKDDFDKAKKKILN